MSTVVNSDLVNREQAASYLGVKPQTLAVWACTKRYPLPMIRVGRSVRYRVRDLERFIEKQTVCNGEPVQ